MNRSLALAVLGLTLAACTAPAASPTPPATVAPTPTAMATLAPTPTATATLAPTPTPTIASTATASPSSVPTLFSPPAIDPCSLLSSAEASAVNGVSYGAGVPHQLDNGFSECVWQSAAPPASMTVQALFTASVDEAQVADAEAQAALAGATIVTVANIGDEAVIARFSSNDLSTGGIYVRSGTTFFDVVYLQGSLPTEVQLTTAATLILGRLP